MLSTDTWREGVVYEQLRTLGWSPDDKFFAYCRGRHKKVVICDVQSGQRAAVFEMDKPIVSGVWLSPRSFVFSDGEQIQEIVRIGEQWIGPQVFTEPEPSSNDESTAKQPIESLQAFSPDTLLWQQGHCIWSSRREARAPVKIWETATTEILVEYSYSQQAKMSLLHCRDIQGDYFAELHLEPLRTVNSLTNLERIECAEYHPTQVRLLNHGRGYAYLNESRIDEVAIEGRCGCRPAILLLMSKVNQ